MEPREVGALAAPVLIGQGVGVYVDAVGVGVEVARGCGVEVVLPAKVLSTTTPSVKTQAQRKTSLASGRVTM